MRAGSVYFFVALDAAKEAFAAFFDELSAALAECAACLDLRAIFFDLSAAFLDESAWALADLAESAALAAIQVLIGSMIESPIIKKHCPTE